MSEKIYEMLWDCGYCGARKLLAKTHRHCPSCGAPQENAPRYFPPEDEKVAVEDHVYVGADALCSACGASASRAANNCGGCGSPLDGTKDVARRQDQLHAEGAAVPFDTAEQAQRELRGGAPALAAPPAQKSKSGIVLGGAGCLLVTAIAVVVLVLLFWRREAAFEVTGHSWVRSIQIERFQTVKETKWCDELPAGATDVRRAKAERSKKKVQDGEDCKIRKVDRGDGTYKELKECTPRFKQEPVYEDECRYEINRWQLDRSEKANGADLSPRWPEPKLGKTGEGLGAEREGKREETLSVELTDTQSHAKHQCDVDADKWSQMKAKSRWKGSLRVVGGGLACGSLTAP